MPLETDRLDLVKLLSNYFEEWEAEQVYSYVFPTGSLQEPYDFGGEPGDGKGNMIVNELIGVERTNHQGKSFSSIRSKNHIINDDMFGIDSVLDSENFCITNLISYVGCSRRKENAKEIYGLIIDLDGIHKIEQFNDVLHQQVFMESKYRFVPVPTFYVTSGSGLHVYYVFEKPIKLFPNVVSQLQKFKQALTKAIWNRYTTDYYQNIQYQSIYQAFRVIGTLTKYPNERTRAFKVGPKLSIDELNEYLPKESQIKDIYYKRDGLSLIECKKLYPEWYDRRIINHDKSVKRWKIEEKVHGKDKWALYHWWLNKITTEASVGHRYFCVKYLVAYARKCNVPKEVVESDILSLFDRFCALSGNEKNPFTLVDVYDALSVYDDDTTFQYKIDIISQRTNIPIQKNKRNGRSQKVHVELMRLSRDYLYPEGSWRNTEGRPTKQAMIQQWRKEHPTGTKADCCRDTGISKPTVLKWWEGGQDENNKASI